MGQSPKRIGGGGWSSGEWLVPLPSYSKVFRNPRDFTPGFFYAFGSFRVRVNPGFIDAADKCRYTELKLILLVWMETLYGGSYVNKLASAS